MIYFMTLLEGSTLLLLGGCFGLGINEFKFPYKILVNFLDGCRGSFLGV